ncbi:MAG: GNAT family N-acetyltransferase [Pseudomonadota bacterium]
MTAPHFEIRPDDVRDEAVIALLEQHLEHMRAISPPESVHALDLDGLRAPDVTFWSVWCGAALAGVGALKAHGAGEGEVKSMRTADPFLRHGVAARLLAHILSEARRRGYRRISLETGSTEHFLPARALYARHGFVICGPFAQYEEDPHSTFMTLTLAQP